MSFYHRRGGDETHSRDGCVPIISPQIFREYFLPDMSVLLLLGCKLEQSVKCILVLGPGGLGIKLHSIFIKIYFA